MDKLNMSDLYGIRMIVLIEESPQSNKYYQVRLNRESFKIMTKTLMDCFPKEEDHKCDDPDCDGTLLETSKNIIDLPDLQEVYDK